MQTRQLLALAALLFLISLSARAQNRTASIPSPSAVTEQEPLSLQQCIELALRQASPLQQAKTEEAIAREEVSQARAALLPRFDYINSYIHTSPLPGLPGVPSFIPANGINEYVNLLTVTQEVDMFGRQRYNLRKAEAEKLASGARSQIAERQLRLAVKEAYYGLLLAQWNRRIAERALEEADSFLKLTQLLQEKGEAAKADVLRAEIARSIRKQERDKAEAQQVSAENDLKSLIGRQMTDELKIVDLFDHAPEKIDFSQFTEAMIRRRPEFSLFAASESSLLQQARLARTERRPQVSYSFSFGFDDSRFLLTHRGLAVTISIRIPLFEWGISKSRERQASLRMQQVELEREMANRQFLSQYYSSRRASELAQERIREAQENVRRATASLDLSKKRYQAGEATILEVVDSQNSKAAAELAYIAALFDYYIAQSRLEIATGR